MLFAAFVLISVDGKHDRLQQRVDLRHRDQPTQVGDVPGLGLQKKQEVAVFLRLVVVGKDTLLHLESILEMARDFILLQISLESTLFIETILAIPLPKPYGSG
jgi:hypothetical protein